MTSWVSKSCPSTTWTSVCYGNGLYVAVASSGTNRVMTSADGSTWNARNASTANSWQSVCYGTNAINNIKYVAVANTGTGTRVMTSEDAITWTTRAAYDDSSWICVCSGNNMYVATGGTDRIMYSFDGITWAKASSDNTGYTWKCICYGNSLFIAMANSSTSSSSQRACYSSNGTSFALFSSNGNLNNTWQSICYGSAGFIAVSSAGAIIQNTTGSSSWTIKTSPQNNAWRSVCYGLTNGSNLYVSISSNGTNRIMTSVDGTTWISQSNPEANTWAFVCSGDNTTSNKYVAVSSDGTNRVMLGTYVNPCYDSSTDILCIVNDEETYVNVKNLTEKNYVKTYLGEYIKIKYILSFNMQNNPNNLLNCMYISKINKHNNNLILTGGHSILVDEINDEQKKIQDNLCFVNCICDKKMLLSCFSDDFEKINNYDIYTCYHIVLESENKNNQYGIYANGFLSESMSINFYEKHYMVN